RDRQREVERGQNGAPQVAVGEELLVVREPAALVGIEREQQAVGERVDEEQQQERHRRPEQQERGHLASAGYTSTRAAGTESGIASPGAARAVLRTCSSCPAARTSTSQSRPQYSAISTVPERRFAPCAPTTKS